MIGDLPATKQRLLARIEQHLQSHPLTGTGFNHYSPTRCSAEHIEDLKKDVSAATLDRFEAAFKAMNSLL